MDNRQAGTGRAVDTNTLENWFSKPSNNPQDETRHSLIRSAGLNLAKVILQNTQPGPDQEAAIQCVRQGVYIAIAQTA